MKVFIGWSGEASKLVAQALREWLRNIIQAVKPWMSEEDINKGAQWNSELAKNLEGTSVGIFCLTKENLKAPWILFEAGAVSKKVGASFVCTYLIGLSPGDVTEPLSQFQATIADKEDTRKLLMTINQALKENALKEDQLNKTFEKWWPDLEEKLKSKPIPKHESKRDTRELLEEILSIVRELARGQYQQTFQAMEEILGTTFGPNKEEGINALRELRNRRDWRNPLVEALCRLKAETTTAGTYAGKEMDATLIRKK